MAKKTSSPLASLFALGVIGFMFYQCAGLSKPSSNSAEQEHNRPDVVSHPRPIYDDSPTIRPLSKREMIQAITSAFPAKFETGHPSHGLDNGVIDIEHFTGYIHSKGDDVVEMGFLPIVQSDNRSLQKARLVKVASIFGSDQEQWMQTHLATLVPDRAESTEVFAGWLFSLSESMISSTGRGDIFAYSFIMTRGSKGALSNASTEPSEPQSTAAISTSSHGSALNKTVHFHDFARKDGTHVNEYDRSPPGSGSSKGSHGGGGRR